jgi:hypothetical protein
MDLDLRGDDARAQAPRADRIAGLLDQRRGGFIAGGFDAEDYHRLEQPSLTAPA